MAARFPYHKLRRGGFWDDEDSHEEERAFRRIRNFSRFRGFSINRRRVKLRIPGLRRFLRKRARFLTRAKASWGKALKRLKNGQAHMHDLLSGNFLVMQVSPSPFKCSVQRPHPSLPASRYHLGRFAWSRLKSRKNSSNAMPRSENHNQEANPRKEVGAVVTC